MHTFLTSLSEQEFKDFLRTAIRDILKEELSKLAIGNENYITIGNFKDDSNTDTINIYAPGTTYYYMVPCSYVFIDAVSAYSINPSGNLPWSYRDTTITAGDSVYIGNYMGGSFNPSWYTYAGSFIANNAGIYVKPSVTSKYIVEFTVCGVPRKDTVQVTVNSGMGVKENNISLENVKLYPNPAERELTISYKNDNEKLNIVIRDISCKIVQQQHLTITGFIGKLDLDLANGVYFVTISNPQHESTTKKLVITR